ncbi:unnamed protein product [Soboliphyme baturini]|uniref:TOG domain-containing protein n=1 Tax=Soboliphyme baturini TaxID=241478 RepID=A0A183ILP4_9BILA|nr:unnamed protein product [Soboliphyme baturini]
MGNALPSKLSEQAQNQLAAMDEELKGLIAKHDIQSSHKALNRKEVAGTETVAPSAKLATGSAKTTTSSKRVLDLFTQLPDDLMDRLESRKWLDRKNGLETLLTAVAVDATFDDVVQCFDAVFVNKNPTMKMQSIRFLARFLQDCTSKEKQKQIFHTFSNRIADIKEKAAELLSNRRNEENVEDEKQIDINDDIDMPTAVQMSFWSFVCPSDAHFKRLKEQLEPICHDKLLKFLFSDNTEDILRATDLLMQHSVAFSTVTHDCSDLLFKWCALRFFNQGAMVIVRLLVFAQRLLLLIHENSHKLSEVEARLFIPHILRLLGHCDQEVFEAANMTLNKVLIVYPTSRMLPMMMDACYSQNSWQTAACLKRIAILIASFEAYIFGNQPEKMVHFIAKFVNDQSSAVREAALCCLLQVYNFLGKDILTYLETVDENSLNLFLRKTEEQKRGLQLLGLDRDIQNNDSRRNVLKERLDEFIGSYEEILKTHSDENAATNSSSGDRSSTGKYEQLWKLIHPDD